MKLTSSSLLLSSRYVGSKPLHSSHCCEALFAGPGKTQREEKVKHPLLTSFSEVTPGYALCTMWGMTRFALWQVQEATWFGLTSSSLCFVVVPPHHPRFTVQLWTSKASNNLSALQVHCETNRCFREDSALNSLFIWIPGRYIRIWESLSFLMAPAQFSIHAASNYAFLLHKFKITQQEHCR